MYPQTIETAVTGKKIIEWRKGKVKRSTALLCLTLTLIIVTPFLFVIYYSTFDQQQSLPEFFVGVEYAIANHSVEGCKALVDKVKNFTNFFVVDSLGITTDIDKLNEVCDYVYDTGLYFMVFFISPVAQQGDNFILRYNFYPHIWIIEAEKKYGEKFLGVYAMDEPGGNQLDQGDFRMILAEDIKTVDEAASSYVELLDFHINYYTYPEVYYCIRDGYTALTADYGLYWYDYKAGYDAILTEFGWNLSRPLHVALCRGAATMQNKEWGVIETWTYTNEPYLTTGEELYSDLKAAYHSGAKYAVIFNHPDTSYSKYGIMTEEHFEALQKFWSYMKSNPDRHGADKGKVAYVLPENFGFGFRSATDKVWGAEPEVFNETWGDWTTMELAEKVWNDVNLLVEKYGYNLDIVYSDPVFNGRLEQTYRQLFFWNQTIN